MRAQLPHAQYPQAGSHRAGVNILAAWMGALGPTGLRGDAMKS
jgi:hypothetical protein